MESEKINSLFYDLLESPPGENPTQENKLIAVAQYVRALEIEFNERLSEQVKNFTSLLSQQRTDTTPEFIRFYNELLNSFPSDSTALYKSDEIRKIIQNALTKI